MSFNIKTGVGPHQSSVSAYSNNKIPVDESFHNRQVTGSQELGVDRASYNITTGKEEISSINDPNNGNAGGLDV